jgi:hypothetical protein
VSPTVRTRTILERFPAHLQADDPGKLFLDVVDSLSGELDVKSSQLGRTRRAHALGDADETTDLRLLAALHGLRDDDFAVLRIRLAALGPLVSYGGELDLLRGSIASVIGLHRDGNGAVGTLLGAAAVSLLLEIERVEHVEGRWWHLAFCRDLLPPTAGEPPADDILALEENPFQPKEIDPIDRHHADVFRVTRGGLEPVTVTIRVVGKGTRTVRPMVVNLDAGYGVSYAGSVADGEELRFESDGRVLLSGTSVARDSYAFRGGVFADAAASHANDFRLTPAPAREATFAVTEPVTDAFEPTGVFPHTEGLLEGAGMSLGESRWAFFVRAAHFGRSAESLADELTEPVFDAGVFDESVYAPGTEPSGAVGFAWQEREPFAATLWIPQRFAALDADGETPLRERVRLFVERYRAAGVHLYAKYADDHWSIGSGLLRDLESTDPRGTVVVGTRVWPPDTVEPTS